MKKIFAALPAIFVTAALAGCNKPAGEQIAEKTVSETITTTAAEMIAEAVSETMEITEAAESVTETETADTEEIVDENSAEPENIFADYDESKFPTGKWQDNYIFRETGSFPRSIDYVEISDYENYTGSDLYTHEEWLTRRDQVIYEFDGNGHYRISLQTHDVFGKYAFEDNVLTLIFEIEFHNGEKFYDEVCFDTVKEENGYRLYYKTAESSDTLNIPVMTDKDDISSAELSAGLSSLFSNFTVRESFLLKYAGESDPNSFKNYIEYIENIS